jgi:DNA-binding transcriptional regulator YhcF (GntR family)
MGSFVAPVERDALRERKLAEVRQELHRLVQSSAKFGISASDIARLARQVEGN